MLILFCGAGNHPGPTTPRVHMVLDAKAMPVRAGFTFDQPMDIPRDWRRVRYRVDTTSPLYDRSTGLGPKVYDPTSPAIAYCCPDHFIPGEPR